MAFEDEKKFDLKRIQREFNIKNKVINNLKIDESELEKIYKDFKAIIPKLENLKNEILNILNNQNLNKVHSIRGRVKDPDHLIEKIIRNVNAKPEKYVELNLENYNKIITDLIGIRIIILDKRDWREIHNCLLEVFRNLPERYVKSPDDIIKNYDIYKVEANQRRKELENSYHAERPIVYITSKEDWKIYQDDNLEIIRSTKRYRSIHYIIRYKYVYFEIQVRTLFEEGWLELDHRIKYPYDQNNDKKEEFVNILSSLAITADKLISFYNDADFQQESDDDIDDTKQEIEFSVNQTEGLTLESKMKLLF